MNDHQAPIYPRVFCSDMHVSPWEYFFFSLCWNIILLHKHAHMVIPLKNSLAYRTISVLSRNWFTLRNRWVIFFILMFAWLLDEGIETCTSLIILYQVACSLCFTQNVQTRSQIKVRLLCAISCSTTLFIFKKLLWNLISFDNLLQEMLVGKSKKETR